MGGAKESVSLFEAECSEGRSCFCEVKQGRTRAKRSAKIGELFPGNRVGVFNLYILPTNWNLLFRQTFLVFCVWLKTVRGQSGEFTIPLVESIKKAVQVVSLHFLVP